MDAKEKLQKAEEEYNEKIYKIAEEEFNKVVLPYLLKKKFHFISGNGTWVIFDPETNHTYHDEDMPAKISECLRTEVPYSDDLGCWMSSYPKNLYK